MALTFPRSDVFTTLKIASQSFYIFSRQELSRTASAETKVKDFGPGIWKASWTSVLKKHDIILDWETIINSLQNGIHSFYASDLRRRYPKNYPTGSFTDSGAIGTITGSLFTVQFKGLPVGLILSRGDYFHYTIGGKRYYHQLQEGFTVNGSGNSPTAINILPSRSPALVVDTAVTFKDPKGLFRPDPNSLQVSAEDPMNAYLSFSAYQVFAE